MYDASTLLLINTVCKSRVSNVPVHVLAGSTGIYILTLFTRTRTPRVSMIQYWLHVRITVCRCLGWLLEGCMYRYCTVCMIHWTWYNMYVRSANAACGLLSRLVVFLVDKQQQNNNKLESRLLPPWLLVCAPTTWSASRGSVPTVRGASSACATRLV